MIPNYKLSGGVILNRDDTIRQLRQALESISARISAGEHQDAAKEKDVFDMVEDARREWQCAMDYFDHVYDPDLVDHAIHAMEAAEKKYTFLLKKARQEGYRLPVKLDALREGR